MKGKHLLYLASFCILSLFGGLIYYALPEKKQEVKNPKDTVLVATASFYPKIENTSKKLMKFSLEMGEIERVEFKNQLFDAYTVNTQEADLAFHFKGKKAGLEDGIIGNFWSLRKYLDSCCQKKPVFITNGGIFKVNREPLGLYIEKGKKIFPLNLKKGAGNFFMQPNAVFYINNHQKAAIVESSAFANLKDTLNYALQSGPMLLNQGEINSHFGINSKNKYIRSGVGVIDENQLVFIISNQPVNFYDFASLFKDKYTCQNALYLDGAISEMYASKLRRYEYGKEGMKYSVLISVSVPK